MQLKGQSRLMKAFVGGNTPGGSYEGANSPHRPRLALSTKPYSPTKPQLLTKPHSTTGFNLNHSNEQNDEYKPELQLDEAARLLTRQFTRRLAR